jgi:nucleoside-diphosphate-sugar epimerase
VDAAAEIVARLSFLPAEAQWINGLREPVMMDTTKAHRELGWRPKHDALSTVRATIEANRLSRMVR